MAINSPRTYLYTYRVILYRADGMIQDIWEFPEHKRKDGFSTPLRDFLFTAFELKEEGGKIEIDKFVSN